jgi:ArsR family metal-binding transcriptional regulator
LSEDEKEEIRQLQEEVDKKQKGIEKLSLEEVKYCINNKMFSIREGNEPLGSIVDTLIAIDPQEFDKLQDLYEASKGLKKEIIPTIDSGYGGSYTYEWSASDNPINLALGDIMDCCARLKWVGEDIMVQSMINPLIQNLIIRDEKGDIVAKSTAYYNKEEQYILFNNVEAIYDLNEKEKKNQSFLNKEEIIKTIMRAINDQINALHEQGSEIREVRVGMKNNDLFTESDLKIVKSNLLPNYPYKKYDGDANHPDYGQGILYRSKIKETITTTKSK